MLVDESAQGCRPTLARLDRTVATITESDAAMPAKELVSLTDTADLYATATGYRASAAAYASGVRRPGDDTGPPASPGG